MALSPGAPNDHTPSGNPLPWHLLPETAAVRENGNLTIGGV